MAFQRQRKTKNTIPQLTIHTPSRNPGSGRRPLRKKEKGTLMMFQRRKNKEIYTYRSKAKSSKPKFRFRKASPKKRRRRNVNDVPKTEEQRNLHLPSKSKVVQAEIQVQEGVP